MSKNRSKYIRGLKMTVQINMEKISNLIYAGGRTGKPFGKKNRTQISQCTLEKLLIKDFIKRRL